MCISDADGDVWVVPNIDRIECEEIINRLFVDGTYDFRAGVCNRCLCARADRNDE